MPRRRPEPDEPEMYGRHPILTARDDERACSEEHERAVYGIDYDPAVDEYRREPIRRRS